MYTILVNGIYHNSWMHFTEALEDYYAMIYAGYGMVELFDQLDDCILRWIG